MTVSDFDLSKQNSIEAKFHLAQTYSDEYSLNNLTNFQNIEKLYLEILELDENNILAMHKLSQFYSGIDRIKEALTLSKKAINLNPSLSFLRANHAVTLTRAGKQKEAENEFKISVALDPRNTQNIYNFCALHKHVYGENYTKHIQNLLEYADISNLDKANLHYSLAEIYHDLKDYELAFHHYKTGAEFKNQEIKFNAQLMELRYLMQKSFCIEAYFNTEKNNVLPLLDCQMIFIIGVPRSGSTLLEQILCSNENAVGLGETTYLEAAIRENITNINDINNFINEFQNLTQETINNIRSSYLQKVQYHLGDITNKIVIDKLLSNFELVNFIRKIFPEAKIIETKRNPIASAWSTFKINFKGNNVPYSYSFRDIAQYYKIYKNFMELWHKYFPNYIYRAKYETIISQPEIEIRKLIKYLNLKWDEKYLNFHENKRSVQTASAMQVREKLYKDSLESWLVYDEYLDVLKNEFYEHEIDLYS